MFRYSLNMIYGFNVYPLRYVFKLIGFSPKAKSKMRQFFEFVKILNKTTYFLVSVHHPNYNIALKY